MLGSSTLGKFLDRVIAVLMIAIVSLAMFLIFSYAKSSGSVTASIATNPETHSHPLINGQPVEESPDIDCLACHTDLP